MADNLPSPDRVGKRLAVVIVTYNRCKDLETTLAALQAMQSDFDHLIVVDNAPTDDATARLVSGRRRTDDSIRYVFDVSDEGLNSMADSYLTHESAFPKAVHPGSLTILDTPGQTIHFTAKRPLSGYGIVVIRGDAIIEPGSVSLFFGLLYVDGNLTIHAPAVLRGAVITTGKFVAQGKGDFVDVVYDDWIINFMQTTMANYRTSRAARRRVTRD